MAPQRDVQAFSSFTPRKRAGGGVHGGSMSIARPYFLAPFFFSFQKNNLHKIGTFMHTKLYTFVSLKATIILILC